MMQRDRADGELIARWKAEEQAPFSGWDFSHLHGRMLEDQPPWSYVQRAGDLLQDAHRVLDIGTGGGERLLDLLPQWPSMVVATEDYPPNVLLSAHRLTDAGASVVMATSSDTAPLPFAGDMFDVVLNRHSGLNAREVARVLSRHGRLFTQQVHGLWAADLLAVFDASPQWPDATPDKYVSQCRAAGLDIVDLAEWSGSLRFTDVGAIVYYLKAVPWLVPGFNVDTFVDHLLRLQAQLDRGEPLDFAIGKYIIEAKKVE